MECRLGLRKPNPAHPTAPATACLETTGPYVAEPIDKIRWVPDNSFDMTKRKQLTSAIRRIAPNGQANEIGFSVNFLSLRHIVQLRTDRHAEWEIRHVFGQVYRLTRNLFPTIYHGAKETVVNGLVEVSGMRSQPYEPIHATE